MVGWHCRGLNHWEINRLFGNWAEKYHITFSKLLSIYRTKPGIGGR